MSQAICESIAMQYTRPLLKNADIMHVGLNIQLKRDKTLNQTELGCVWSRPGVNMRGGFVSHIILRTTWHTQTIWHSWRKTWGFLVLVCANTKRNYAHLNDPDAFFARPEHSVEPCHVSVEFSTRPVPFKLILISCLLCLCLTTDLPPSDFRISFCMRLAFILHMILSAPTLSSFISPPS